MSTTANSPAEYAKTALDRYGKIDDRLRGWFVLYGIGIVGLFLTQADKLADISPGCRSWIAAMSLIPPVLQILVQTIYKFSNHATYVENEPTEVIKYPRPLYQSLQWFANHVCLDMLIDVVSIGMYVAATILMIISLSASPAKSITTPTTTGVARDHDQRFEEGNEKGSKKGGDEDNKEEGGQESSKKGLASPPIQNPQPSKP